MKRLFIFLMVFSLFTACNNDKAGKDKIDRDKTAADSTRPKDDYSNTDKKETEKKEEMKSDDNKTIDGPADNGGDEWTRTDENKFMSDCEGTATPNVGAARANEYCDCVLQKLKKMYSSYTDANNDLQSPGSEAKMTKLTDACNGR